MTTSPLPTLLARITADPGRPRLTWYGADGERIELSGQVLDNWVTKTTNLLVEEYDCGPGTRVVLDLPVHWRAVVWAFAVWRTGACVVLPDAAPGSPGGDPQGAPDAAVVVTHRPARWSADGVVAVALPALARSFDGGLPPGATDAAAAVMTYGDVLTWVPEVPAGADALATVDGGVRFGDLLAWARSTAQELWRPGPWWDETLAGRPARALLEPLEPLAESVHAVLAAAVVALDADGSVVLCAPEVSAELAVDAERRRRLLEAERVTAEDRG